MRVEGQDSHAIVGLEKVEKRIDPLQDVHLSDDTRRMPPEIGLKKENEKTAARRRHIHCGVDVRRRLVDFGELALRGRFGNPIDRFDDRRLSVDAHPEVGRLEIGDRIAARIGHPRVDEDALDSDPLLVLLFLKDKKGNQKEGHRSKFTIRRCAS